MNSKNSKLVARVKKLYKQGLSMRQIEARFPVSLGGGNGTKVLRILRAA